MVADSTLFEAQPGWCVSVLYCKCKGSAIMSYNREEIAGVFWTFCARQSFFANCKSLTRIDNLKVKAMNAIQGLLVLLTLGTCILAAFEKPLYFLPFPHKHVMVRCDVDMLQPLSCSLYLEARYGYWMCWSLQQNAATNCLLDQVRIFFIIQYFLQFHAPEWNETLLQSSKLKINEIKTADALIHKRTVLILLV